MMARNISKKKSLGKQIAWFIGLYGIALISLIAFSYIFKMALF